MNNKKYTVRMCSIPDCKFPPNIALRKAIQGEIKENNLEDVVTYEIAGCTGHCAPFFVIREENGPSFIYEDMNPERVKKIFKEHLINGNPVEEWVTKI